MHPYPLITIIGGSGFVGRHTVRLLASQGYRIRVLVRDCIAAEFLKTAGYPGQIAIEYADITRPQTLAGKCDGSHAVINLAGVLYPTRRQNFTAVHVTGSKAIATEARRANAARLIHLSALGIERSNATAYGRTKLAGELAAREAFPGAVILRPSLIIGPEDGFFQRFARMALISPILPLIGGGKTKFQPILVIDVAQAILKAITSPTASGRTFELAGDKIYSFRDLLMLMRSITHRKTRLISIPFFLARLKALAAEMVSHFTPWPPLLTREQVKLLAYDSVASDTADGVRQLGFSPSPVAAALPAYLARYTQP